MAVAHFGKLKVIDTVSAIQCWCIMQQQDIQPHLIPTRGKAKLSKALTWPIGAEAITAGLGDAPHASEFTLWFGNSPVWRGSEFQQMLREARPYTVMAAEYTPTIIVPYGQSKARAAAGHYDPKWQIRINPVPRPLRATAAALIGEQGLPAIVDWLHSFKGTGWQERCRRLELVFAPSQRTLTRKFFEGV